MARYLLHLHDGPATPPITETLDVSHDADALDLAQVVLLVTAVYTHAEVYRGPTLIGSCKRDSHAE
ncbi:hypothetical protein [Brevundimonas sp.]|jgi:hypothetical protein|uniref:hypothetical protein n=1 Tax=unclassified Brevundimonas TaxID=2622653 RepID=UPI00356B5B33